MIKTSLDTVKQRVSEAVIKMLPEMRYMTESQKLTYTEELKAKLQNRMLITDKRPQSGRTNAEDFNQTAFELWLDVLTTFNYLEELYETINTHQKLNRSIMNTLRSTIASLNDKLDEVESMIGLQGSPKCVKEGFRTQNNQEWDKSFYTERYGESVPLEAYARFNPDQETLTLGYSRQQNVMTYKSGVQLGEAIITRQYGKAFITARNSQTKLANAIDTSMSSYWAETILSDDEMSVIGQGYEPPSGLGRTNRSYYDLPKGALCEICLVFEAMAKVNELILNPFGSYPIDIVAIRYSLTDDDDDDVFDVVTPDRDDWLRSRSIDGEYAFHFPQITCKRLYILINQLHCIKDTYLLSANQMFKNELWFNATYDETADARMDPSAVFQPLYLDRAEEDPVWTYVNNNIVTTKSIDISDMLIKNKNRMLPVTKYQYTYGFYNIAPNFVEFQLAGVWVSQEIDAGRPIDSIRIRTDEEHFIGWDGRKCTDIELYITTKKNPSYEDWKPICPYNKDYIDRELLQTDYEYCYLRHAALCTRKNSVDNNGNVITVTERPIVYMDDTVLTENVDYILRYNEDGTAKAIEISNIDHFAMYTVSYTPSDSSKEVVLAGIDTPVPNTSYEEMQGNGTSCYPLDGYPYYDPALRNGSPSMVRIIDTTTGIAISQNSSNSMIECVTDVANPAGSFKNFIANTEKIQYYTYGKNLFFNRPIGQDKKIEINYPSLDSKVRVKAILRRNSRKDIWITPVLHGYSLEFTTL